MKKIFTILLFATLLTACIPPAEAPAPTTQPESTTETSTEPSAEEPPEAEDLEATKQLFLTNFDITEEEAQILIDFGHRTQQDVQLWLDEQDAMGPGPFDFNADLADVSGGSGTGYAGALVVEGTYTLHAKMENLPHPEQGYFYEGWVVRSEPLSVISTGEATRSFGKYYNGFTSDQDLTDHTQYVLTLEPDDGDPAPAEHILEGTMK